VESLSNSASFQLAAQFLSRNSEHLYLLSSRARYLKNPDHQQSSHFEPEVSDTSHSDSNKLPQSLAMNAGDNRLTIGLDYGTTFTGMSRLGSGFFLFSMLGIVDIVSNKI
jgi:hypothetical protein